MQLLWVGAWVPYWMRLLLMLPLYTVATVTLLLTQRRVAWQRGALPLALFNVATAILFLVPKLSLGVFTDMWQVRAAPRPKPKPTPTLKPELKPELKPWCPNPSPSAQALASCPPSPARGRSLMLWACHWRGWPTRLSSQFAATHDPRPPRSCMSAASPCGQPAASPWAALSHLGQLPPPPLRSDRVALSRATRSTLPITVVLKVGLVAR